MLSVAIAINDNKKKTPLLKFYHGSPKVRPRRFQGPVLSLALAREGLVTGGEDGLVKLWTSHFDVIKTIRGQLVWTAHQTRSQRMQLALA